jgi:hypothetical protein
MIYGKINTKTNISLPFVNFQLISTELPSDGLSLANNLISSYENKIHESISGRDIAGSCPVISNVPFRQGFGCKRGT